MHCKHCGFANGDDDHRCLRCGRRLTGIVIAAPPGFSGANALAAVMAGDNDTKELDTKEFASAHATASGQTALFAPPISGPRVIPRVIPFDRRQRQAAHKLAPAPPAPGPESPRPPAARRTPVRRAATPAEQGMLDFIPAAPARNRRLKTEVDAQVFCEQPVATPTHRFVASCVDSALILVGFGVLVAAFQALGGSFGPGRMFWLGLSAALMLVSVFYGLIWAIAGRETAGMSFTDLQLITFDGFPLDARSRALRIAATWLSICSGGLGILWAVADEENLTWHDHISKTFPTIREDPRAFVKQRR